MPNVNGNVEQLHPEKPHMSAMQSFRALLGVIQRTRLGRALTSFDGQRNYQEIFGWDDCITVEKMAYMYNRSGIAKRVVDAYPDATWARPPVLWAEGDDNWTNAWADMVDQSNLWDALYRMDRLACLGQYSILVIGTDRPNLAAPIGKARRITYLQPYGENTTRIEEYDRNQASPTFGMPLLYRIYPEGPSLEPREIGRTPSRLKSNFPRSSFLVHASRIIHCARGALEDTVFGQPMMAPCWDYLTDLRKVVGSSSESYWIMANRGLQADIDKEMSLNAEDQANLQSEIDDFYNGFRRFIRTKGVEITPLTNEVADPKGPFEVLVTLISGATGIPKRILLGSEAGQLASTQDKGNWAERVEENRTLHVEPRIIRPFLRFVLNHAIIPPPKQDAALNILWPDAYRMSPLERGQTSAQTARTIANVTKMLESKSQEARTLLSQTELRALVGFPSDNRILRDNPNP
jgi:hypothetical protein